MRRLLVVGAAGVDAGVLVLRCAGAVLHFKTHLSQTRSHDHRAGREGRS